jgi:pimeloyl-ACP methyl ester carboxylesterase
VLKIAALLLLILCGSAEAKPRIYVLYGQGGAATSLGMVALADRLKAHGTVTRHNWNDYSAVAASIRKLPADTPVVLVGFSLGAGVTTWISNALPKRRIALIVAYDPSIWQPIQPARANVARLLLYRNVCPDLWGHATIAGKMVETTNVCTLHLVVPLDERLHRKTIAAIRRL